MNKGKKQISLNNIIDGNGALYFWDLEINELFQINNQFQADIVKLHNRNVADDNLPLYGKILYFQNKIIGVPLAANAIFIYDLGTEEYRYISLEKYSFEEKNAWRGKFWDAVIDDKYAYFIGYWSKKILKLDLLEEKIINVVEIECDANKEIDDIYFKQAAIYGDKLLVPFCQRNEVCVLDKQSMNYGVKKFTGTEDGFSSLLIDGDNIWMAPRRTGKFVRWNQEVDVIDYLDYPDECKTKRPSFGFMEKYNDVILVFPLHAPFVLNINRNTKKIEINSELSELCQGNNDVQKAGFVSKHRDEMLIYRRCDGSIVKYNLEKHEWKIEKVIFSQKSISKIMHKEINRRGFLREGVFSLQDLLHDLNSLGGGLRYE